MARTNYPLGVRAMLSWKREKHMRPNLLQIKMNRAKASPDYHHYLHNKIGLTKTLASLIY